MRRYWVIRSDRDNRELLWKELQAGRLRQGWGYLPEQDLRIVQRAEKNESITDDQRSTWRGNRRMLDSEPNSIQRHDLIVSPHLPA
jgi:hypothetical protein